MKKILIYAALFAAMAAYSESGVTAMPKQIETQSVQSSSDWEYVGDVTLYYFDRNCGLLDSCNAELYVKSINGYLFYRVYDHHNYYNVAANPKYNPNASDFVSQCKYIAGDYYIKNI